MVQQFFHILLISTCCIGWGLPVILISQTKGNAIIITPEKIILSFFTGLSLIGLAAAWICLWLPLTWVVLLLATTVPVSVTIFLFKKFRSRLNLRLPKGLYKKNSVFLLVFSAVSIILFLILGSNHPVMIDTDLYHLQIIRWNQAYGTVPGLANLYLRYGFYSNWLSLISIFALPFKNENYLYLNITLGIWFLLFLIQKLSLHLQRYSAGIENRVFSWAYIFTIILLYAEWGLFRVNASSTSYDFIVSCIVLIVLLQLTEDIVFGSTEGNTHLIPILILSASAPFFKLSGLAIVLIAFIYLLSTRKKKFFYPVLILTGVLFTIPFLYRNYIQTGYPLYPYTLISWGHPDWQVPGQMADRISRYISLGNRYFNQPIPEAEQLNPSFHWITTWFSHIPLADQLLVILALLGLPVYILYARKSFLKNSPVVYIYMGSSLALLLWFILSPDPRFAYGYLLFLAAFPLSFLAAKFLRFKLIYPLLSIISIGLAIYGAGKYNFKNSIAPQPVFNPVVTSVSIHNARYNLPVKTNNDPRLRCYYSALPCIYELNPYLEQRGEGLNQGFRMNRSLDSVFIINYGY